jgi:hypothetical protein
MSNFDEALACTLTALQGVVDSGLEVHYVAGPISADGDEHIERNLEVLLRHGEQVAKALGSRALVLTSPLVFTPDIYASLKIFEKERGAREQSLQAFWDHIIGSGVLAAIHFAPGWKRSPGARLEHEAANRHNVNVYYLQD